VLDHPGDGTLGGRGGQEQIKIQKTVAFPEIIYYYWNQAGEATPTKARLTSLKTPEAILPGARKGLGLPKTEKQDGSWTRQPVRGIRGFASGLRL
jgi:hypothetical protein